MNGNNKGAKPPDGRNQPSVRRLVTQKLTRKFMLNAAIPGNSPP